MGFYSGLVMAIISSVVTVILFLFRKIHLIFLLDITWSLYSFLMVVGFILSSIILVVAVMS